MLTLRYDGLFFHGWQIQPQKPTVQEVIEEALVTITGERVRLRGAGRTDAGVHALGQVANFRTSSPLAPETILRALNGIVPSSLAVVGAREVPPDFDSRFSALGKIYRYRILPSPIRDPLRAGRVWQVPWPVSLHRMRRGAFPFVGTNDFSSFRASGCASRNPVRTLRRLQVRKIRDEIHFELEGDGFLRYMVRNIVGTLVDVGRGKLEPSDIPPILDSRDRRCAGRTAPAQGLYLVEVQYSGDFP